MLFYFDYSLPLQKMVMAEVGKYNRLKVVKAVDFGLYLDGGDGQEILLPTRYVPQNTGVGDEIEVFIYHDNEGRLIATTARPKATVGEFQFLQVREVNEIGAFLDWGIMKDLFVPFREQRSTMQAGRWYTVFIRIDEVTGRIMGTARIEKYLNNTPPPYEYNQEVQLLVFEENEFGYKAVINNLHSGLIYRDDVFRKIEIGEHLKGYIKEIREDGKIDLSIVPLGYAKVEGIAGMILESLRLHGGFLPVGDKSDPEEIHALFHCSKKAFKQAVGALYKQKRILLEAQGIRLA